MDSLGERLAEYAAHLDAAMHRFLSDLRHFDEGGGWAQQGAQSCAHWLAWRLGMDLNTAREHLRVAHRLAALPLVDDALRRGSISYSKVRAITRVAVERTEAVLVGMAEHTTATQLETICRKLRTTQRKPTDPNELSEQRYLTRRDLDDGMTQVTARLRPEEAARLFAVLDTIAAERTREASEDLGRVDHESACDVSAETRSPGPGEPGHNVSAETWASRRGEPGHDVSAEVRAPRRGEPGHDVSAETPGSLNRAPGHDVSAETRAPRPGEPGHDVSAETPGSLDPASGQDVSAETWAPANAECDHDGSAETPPLDGAHGHDGSSGTQAAPDGEPNTSAKRAGKSARRLRGHRFDRCDALMELVERQARGRQVDRAPIELVVTVSAAALTEDPATDPLDRAGVTQDGSCLTIPTVRRLACDAGVVVIVEDEHGSPLSVGRKHRTVTTALKRALAQRDPHCQFPGCTNSVFMEAHHLEHWIDGGKTEIGNMINLCTHHHDWIHTHHFAVELGSPPRFYDERGLPIQHVPPRPQPTELGWSAIRGANAHLGIREDTNAPRWDGDDIDYEAAIAELCRLEDLLHAPDEWTTLGVPDGVSEANDPGLCASGQTVN